MKTSILALAAVSLAVVGAGCAPASPAPLVPSNQPVAPAAAPTQAPVIPDNAKNVPPPASNYNY